MSMHTYTDKPSDFAGRPRGVVLTGPGYQDHDNIACGYGLRGRHVNVDFATAEGDPVTGKYGTTVPLDKTWPQRCVPFAELDVDRYDFVIATGGHEAPDRVRQDKRATGFVAAMAAAGKPVAGLCHGPWVLVSAGVLKGRHAAAYPGLVDDVRHAGAIIEDADVVVDDHIVTCRYYGAVGLFLEQLIALVEQRHARHPVPA
jgi:protease I